MADSRRTERLIKELVKILPEEYTFEIGDSIYNYTNKEKGIGTLNNISIGIRDNHIEYCDYTYNIVNNEVHMKTYEDYLYKGISLISMIEKIGPQRVLHEIWSSIQYKLGKYNYAIKRLEELIYGED